MANIRDVAELAGVSVATVSHVLNNTRPVLPETRKLVLDAIEQLNYRPNTLARSLNTNITHMVGVLVADITNPFFAALVRGIERRLSVQNYNVIVCNTDERVDQEARYLELLLDKRVDGLIIAPTGERQPNYERFAERKTPLIFLDRVPPDAYGPHIGLDNSAAGYLATDHLLALGHRRIAIMSRRTSMSTVAGRIDGYCRALRAHGLNEDERLMIVTRSTLESAFQAARHILSQPDRPTAVVTANYVMLLGLLYALPDLQLTCPGDVSIVAFDDHPWAGAFTPPITVVQQPIEAMCEAAVSTLLDCIASNRQQKGDTDAGPADPSPPMLFHAELIARASARRLET